MVVHSPKIHAREEKATTIVSVYRVFVQATATTLYLLLPFFSMVVHLSRSVMAY